MTPKKSPSTKRKSPSNRKNFPSPNSSELNYCPLCQLPLHFLKITGETHLIRCEQNDWSNAEECKEGIECYNSNFYHYLDFTHFNLAKHRSTNSHIDHNDNANTIDSTKPKRKSKQNNSTNDHSNENTSTANNITNKEKIKPNNKRKYKTINLEEFETEQKEQSVEKNDQIQHTKKKSKNQIKETKQETQKTKVKQKNQKQIKKISTISSEDSDSDFEIFRKKKSSNKTSKSIDNNKSININRSINKSDNDNEEILKQHTNSNNNSINNFTHFLISNNQDIFSDDNFHFESSTPHCMKDIEQKKYEIDNNLYELIDKQIECNNEEQDDEFNTSINPSQYLTQELKEINTTPIKHTETNSNTNKYFIKPMDQSQNRQNTNNDLIKLEKESKSQISNRNEKDIINIDKPNSKQTTSTTIKHDNSKIKIVNGHFVKSEIIKVEDETQGEKIMTIDNSIKTDLEQNKHIQNFTNIEKNSQISITPSKIHQQISITHKTNNQILITPQKFNDHVSTTPKKNTQNDKSRSFKKNLTDTHQKNTQDVITPKKINQKNSTILQKCTNKDLITTKKNIQKDSITSHKSVKKDITSKHTNQSNSITLQENTTKISFTPKRSTQKETNLNTFHSKTTPNKNTQENITTNKKSNNHSTNDNNDNFYTMETNSVEFSPQNKTLQNPIIKTNANTNINQLKKSSDKNETNLIQKPNHNTNCKETKNISNDNDENLLNSMLEFSDSSEEDEKNISENEDENDNDEDDYDDYEIDSETGEMLFTDKDKTKTNLKPKNATKQNPKDNKNKNKLNKSNDKIKHGENIDEETKQDIERFNKHIESIEIWKKIFNNKQTTSTKITRTRNQSNNNKQRSFNKTNTNYNIATNENVADDIPNRVPFYKLIPNTDFVVDGFKSGPIFNKNNYFLSHFHYDHYIGLKRNFNKTIHCSSITKQLLITMIKINENYIHTIDVDECKIINQVEVTAIDANHCPGALMFIFKTLHGDCYLHTGDFRSDVTTMRHIPILRDTYFDKVYLDTTYCNPQYTFPKQRVVLDKLIQLVEENHRKSPNTLYVCGSYTIGKEKVYISILQKMKWKIYVESSKRRILSILNIPIVNKYLTNNPNEAKVHVLSMSKLNNIKSLCNYFETYKNKYNNLIAIKPTGWVFNEKQIQDGDFDNKFQDGDDTNTSYNINIKKVSNLISIYEICYSEHSSFIELCEFINFIKYKQIITTVNVKNNFKQIQIIQNYIENNMKNNELK